MIKGIGVDIVQIPRIHKLFIKYQNRFINKLLNPKEKNKIIDFSSELKSRYLAKRFAAKEAIAKALGTGFRQSLNFKDIIILNDELGKPYAIIDKFKTLNIHLSISDDYPLAIAFAIIED